MSEQHKYADHGGKGVQGRDSCILKLQSSFAQLLGWRLGDSLHFVCLHSWMVKASCFSPANEQNKHFAPAKRILLPDAQNRK